MQVAVSTRSFSIPQNIADYELLYLLLSVYVWLVSLCVSTNLRAFEDLFQRVDILELRVRIRGRMAMVLLRDLRQLLLRRAVLLHMLLACTPLKRDPHGIRDGVGVCVCV